METISSVIENPGFSAFKADKKISFIRPYDAKSPAIAEYRHAVIRYRDTTKGVSVKPAKMVTIPQIKLPENDFIMPEVAQKVLIGVLEDEQDILIRDAIETGASLIEWDNVNVDSCFAALTAVRVSQRMTKEQIDAWVKVALKSQLETRANQISDSNKHDTLQRQTQVALTVNRYAELFSRLSAPVPNLDNEQCIALKNQLTLSNLGDDISKALGAKLHALLNPVAANNGDL